MSLVFEIICKIDHANLQDTLHDTSHSIRYLVGSFTLLYTMRWPFRVLCIGADIPSSRKLMSVQWFPCISGYLIRHHGWRGGGNFEILDTLYRWKISFPALTLDAVNRWLDTPSCLLKISFLIKSLTTPTVIFEKCKNGCPDS